MDTEPLVNGISGALGGVLRSQTDLKSRARCTGSAVRSAGRVESMHHDWLYDPVRTVAWLTPQASRQAVGCEIGAGRWCISTMMMMVIKLGVGVFTMADLCIGQCLRNIISANEVGSSRAPSMWVMAR
ncbi:hypothetical protein BV22DRAFT_723774 [Leucogyrophana mollusca]|uniref:Uncharacterized protein n=1 Tax=Leucogyrophana mollusca TaxID=85980 RepID=A0ACB8B9E4_9AGAM|nr:hypothetical protein BV22DRAFT_723774 [Leucogyrophana mollusca]